jgi:hypothetical protein
MSPHWLQTLSMVSLAVSIGCAARIAADMRFLMQIGMAAGVLTSYPVNWWLVSKGVKEKM